MLKELKELKKIVSTKSKTLLLLQNVAIEVKETIIAIYAYNNEHKTVMSVILAHTYGLQKCNFLVNFKDLMGAIPKGDFTLETTIHNLLIKNELGESALPINTKDFETFMEYCVSRTTDNPIYQMAVTDQLKQLIPFTRDEPSRYQMNTININNECFVATDTKRLGIIKHLTPFQFESEEGINLNPILAKFQGVLHVFKEFSSIHLKDLDIFVYAKNINDKFPLYKKAILTTEKDFTVNRKDLINALKSVLPFTNEITKSIKLTVRDNLLSLYASMLEKGEKTATIKTDSNTFFEANYNPKFLLEALEFFKDDTITIQFVDEKHPLLIEQENKLMLVMPVLPRF